MKANFYLFEGSFRSGDPKYGLKGVASSCIVPEEDVEKAYRMFIQALSENDIELREVIETYVVDIDEVDESSEEGQEWIDWINEAYSSEEVVFDPWQVFQ